LVIVAELSHGQPLRTAWALSDQVRRCEQSEAESAQQLVLAAVNKLGHIVWQQGQRHSAAVVVVRAKRGAPLDIGEEMIVW
jgi:hypothetical protein